MSWHIIYTKPRQEFRAQENLRNQGFEVFLPTYKVEKLYKNKLVKHVEAMFSRYLFIRLDDVTSNWFPIRSTRGVSQLLRFGSQTNPVVVPQELIQDLNLRHEQELKTEQAHSLFATNDVVEIKEGPFQGFHGFYQHLTQQKSGEARAMLLLELLGRQQQIQVGLHQIEKIG